MKVWDRVLRLLNVDATTLGCLPSHLSLKIGGTRAGLDEMGEYEKEKKRNHTVKH